MQKKHVIFVACYDVETLFAIKACREIGVSYAIVFHGLDIIVQTNSYSKRLRKLFYSAVKEAKYIIFNSQATKEIYNQSIGIEKKSIIVYPGINKEKILDQFAAISFHDKEYLKQFENKRIILSIGSLVERKGFDLAIEAINRIFENKKYDNFVYLIVGEGEFGNQLRNMIDNYKLNSRIKLLGNVNNSLKYGLLKMSDLFLMPSHTLKGKNVEGFGIVFLEAALFDNYVIGGNTGGMPEAIVPEPSGKAIEINLNRNDRIIDDEIQEKLDRIIDGSKAEIPKKWLNSFDWNYIVEQFLNELKTIKI